MNRPSHFFNIESADQLFDLLKTVAKRFLSSDEMQTEYFLLLVFGLTHLREWIAPGYDWKNDPQTPAEILFRKIFKLKEFKLLQGLCNRSKHMCATNDAMAPLFEIVREPSTNDNSVSQSGRRNLVGFFVNGNDMEDVFRVVIKFYEDNWFSKCGNHQNAT